MRLIASNAVLAVAGYEVQVTRQDTDPYFLSPQIDAIVPGTSYRAYVNPAPGSVTFQWRVRALLTDGTTSNWSSVWTFV